MEEMTVEHLHQYKIEEYLYLVHFQRKGTLKKKSRKENR